MKQRTILIHVQVDADKYEGQTDEQIMDLLFEGNSLPGGANVKAIHPKRTSTVLKNWETVKRGRKTHKPNPCPPTNTHATPTPGRNSSGAVCSSSSWCLPYSGGWGVQHPDRVASG